MGENMWNIEKDGAILNLKSVNSKEFKLVQDRHLTLIVPKKNKWDWEENEKWLRSVVVDESGRVVSCGWPKFGNYNEFDQDTKDLDEALAGGDEVIYTLKHDGSLAIRSVIGGEVIFRTRGTLFGGEYDQEGNEPFGVRIRRAAEKHPLLLDPQWQPNRSLLFEYVSPDNKIVLSYKEESLVFLGFVDHNLRIGTWKEVQDVAVEGSLSLVEICELPYDSALLLATIKDWEQEGVVARCCDSRVMVKVKSASYLSKHRIKHNMKYSFIVEFVKLAGVESEEQLVSELSKGDLDFETVSEGVIFYKKYCKAINEFERSLEAAKKVYNSFVPNGDNPKEIRKQYALLACSQEGSVRSLMFALYDNKESVFRSIRNRFILMGDK